MSKITFLSFLIALSFTISAQPTQQKNSGKIPIYNSKPVLKKGNGSTVVTSIYTEDFAQGLPLGWAITDSSGQGKVWTYTTTGPLNFPADSLQSTTAYNGYMIMDDDSYGLNSPTKTELISTAINCSGIPFVRVKFQDFFRNYVPANCEAIFQISTDSITWTSLYHAEAGLATNESTANPNYVDINISAIAANQPTVYLKFTYRGNWGYSWEIDDIELYEPALVDAELAAAIVPINGCQLSSVNPVSVTIINDGVNPIFSIPVSYSVNGLNPVNEIATDTIAPGDSLLYTFIQTADLMAPGTYTLSFNCDLANDTNVINDTVSFVTTSYAQSSVQTTAYTMGFEPSEDFSGWIAEDVDGDGVTVDITSNDTYAGVGCLRKPATISAVADDNWIYTTCFNFKGGTDYLLKFWYKNFELVTPCQVAAFVGKQNNSSFSTKKIVVCPIPTDTTYQYSATSFKVANNGVYYIGFHLYTATPGASEVHIDDIEVSIITGIDNPADKLALKCYPNPTNGLITLSGAAYKGVVTVFNQMGQMVLQKSFESLNNIGLDLSAQPVGLYQIQVKSKDAVSNQTITISR